MAVEATLETTRKRLAALDAKSEGYAAQFVDTLLEAAHRLGRKRCARAPTPEGIDVAVRIDGVLQSWGTFAAGEVSNVVTRLKVLADLLTYRTDVPQEGRVRNRNLPPKCASAAFQRSTAKRPSCGSLLPKVAIRFQTIWDYRRSCSRLRKILDETSGALLITGPAGSGKTTTAYACLREAVRQSKGGRSIVTLEDPIEVALSGVAQSQVNPRAGFDLAAGLRSLLRQDPEVILVGEMRDAETAGVAFQAALTGQLVLTTFHAGSSAGAISRLLDMGLEPYVLRSGIQAVICQRLVRKLCQCAAAGSGPESTLGLPVASAKIGEGMQPVSRHGLPRADTAGRAINAGHAGRG